MDFFGKIDQSVCNFEINRIAVSFGVTPFLVIRPTIPLVPPEYLPDNNPPASGL